MRSFKEENQRLITMEENERIAQRKYKTNIGEAREKYDESILSGS